MAVALAVTASAQTAARKRVQDRIEELIRKAIAEQARKPDTNAPSPLQVVYHDIERQYLNGELTAHQFMFISRELQLFAGTNTDARALSSLPDQLRARLVTNAAAALGTNNAASAEDAAFADIEKKIDELIARKEQFQRSTATNAPPEVEPKTRRGRLDYLLQLYVNEKITREEYEARRAKALAEPDTPAKP